MQKQPYANTKRAIAAAIAALALSPFSGRADILTVDKGNPVTISSKMEVSGVNAHDMLTVASGGKLSLDSSAQAMKFGIDSGDVGALRVQNGGSLVSGSVESKGVIVGGTTASPAIHFKGNFWDSLFPYWLQLSASAESDADEIDFLRLESQSGTFHPTSFAGVYRLMNSNSKPAVVTFAGMGLIIPNGNASYGIKVRYDTRKFIFRSSGGNPLCFMSSATWDKTAAWAFPLEAVDEGVIEFDNGSAPILFGPKGFRQSDGYRFAGHAIFRRAYDSGKLVWSGTGPVCFTNFSVVVQADNALPYREDTAIPLYFGFHRGTGITPTVPGGVTNVVLDVSNHTAKVGSLYMGEGTYVTNSAATAGELVLGADGLHSVFSGKVYGNVAIRCASSDVEILPGSEIAKLVLDGGPISIPDGVIIHEVVSPAQTSANSISIPSGATVDIGAFASEPVWHWDHSYTNLYFGNNATSGWQMARSMKNVVAALNLADGAHQVAVAAGGTATIAGNGDMEAEYLRLVGGGTLRKSGSGRVSIVGDGRLSLGRVEVLGGTLALQGAGCTNEWYRFKVTSVNKWAHSIAFGQIGVFGGNGTWLCQDTKYDSEVSSASELAKGKFLIDLPASGLAFEDSDTYSPNFAFITSPLNRGFKFYTNPDHDQIDLSVTPMVLEFRLPNNSAPAIWHSIATIWNAGNQPYGWVLETSPNGENGWTEVVSVNQGAPKANENYYYWRNDRRYDTESSLGSEGLPWRIRLNNAIAHGNALGVVRVDSGATLDLTGDADATISGFEVDWANRGGTIRSLDVPANGTLNLVNVPAGADISGTTILSLPGATGAANLRSWTVTVNGAAKAAPIQIAADGTVSLGSAATVIMMR